MHIIYGCDFRWPKTNGLRRKPKSETHTLYTPGLTPAARARTTTPPCTHKTNIHSSLSLFCSRFAHLARLT